MTEGIALGRQSGSRNGCERIGDVRAATLFALAACAVLPATASNEPLFSRPSGPAAVVLRELNGLCAVVLHPLEGSAQLVTTLPRTCGEMVAPTLIVSRDGDRIVVGEKQRLDVIWLIDRENGVRSTRFPRGVDGTEVGFDEDGVFHILGTLPDPGEGILGRMLDAALGRESCSAGSVALDFALDNGHWKVDERINAPGCGGDVRPEALTNWSRVSSGWDPRHTSISLDAPSAAIVRCHAGWVHGVTGVEFGSGFLVSRGNDSAFFAASGEYQGLLSGTQTGGCMTSIDQFRANRDVLVVQERTNVTSSPSKTHVFAHGSEVLTLHDTFGSAAWPGNSAPASARSALHIPSYSPLDRCVPTEAIPERLLRRAQLY